MRCAEQFLLSKLDNFELCKMSAVSAIIGTKIKSEMNKNKRKEKKVEIQNGCRMQRMAKVEKRKKEKRGNKEKQRNPDRPTKQIIDQLNTCK